MARPRYYGDDIVFYGTEQKVREQARFMFDRARKFHEYAVRHGYKWSRMSVSRRTVSVYVYVKATEHGPSAIVRFSDHAGHDVGHDVDWYFRAKDSTLLGFAEDVIARWPT